MPIKLEIFFNSFIFGLGGGIIFYCGIEHGWYRGFEEMLEITFALGLPFLIWFFSGMRLYFGRKKITYIQSWMQYNLTGLFGTIAAFSAACYSHGVPSSRVYFQIIFAGLIFLFCGLAVSAIFGLFFMKKGVEAEERSEEIIDDMSF